MNEAQLYVLLYYNLLLIGTLLISYYYREYNSHVEYKLGIWTCVILVLYFAFRPISSKYGLGDTKGYAFFFKLASEGINAFSGKDVGFAFIVDTLRGLPVWVFFGVLALLYVVPLLMSSKILFKERYGLAFWIIICSFSFFSYAVNGMRNGAATSLVLLGIVSPRKLFIPILFIIAASIHKSILLILVAYIVTLFYNKSKPFLIGWFICLILSIFISDFLTSVIPISDILGNDDRIANYLTGTYENSNASFSHTGFRVDFLLYSVIPIYIGWRAIFKYNLDDNIYITLYNIYLFCNAFWLFTIYVPYNNRFAYLSWFLYPILISYPYLKENSDNNYSKISTLVLLNYAFTYFMWI